jgi:hypothetical protein
VTEINASHGSLMQNLSASSYDVDYAGAIAFDGTHLGRKAKAITR